MADQSQEKDRQKDDPQTKEPKGFTEHAHGPASEAAREQGWDLNEEQRAEQPKGRPAHYGGKGYDYGAQDFGDTPAKRDNPEGASDEPESDEEKKAS